MSECVPVLRIIRRYVVHKRVKTQSPNFPKQFHFHHNRPAAKNNKKLRCRKDDSAMRPIYGWRHENFRESLTTPTATFPNILMGFCSDPMNVRSFTRSCDNRGYLPKLGSPWIRPRSLFSKILIGFCSDGPCECTSQIRSP